MISSPLSARWSSRILLLALASSWVSCASSYRAPEAPPAQITAGADGHELAYRQAGSGFAATPELPGLLFVHGWCGQGSQFQGALEHFGGKRAVAALDLSGHGGSGTSREAWDFEVLAGDVLAVVEALGWEHVILVGHSMGGPVSVQAAQQAGSTAKRVHGVVVVNGLHDASVRVPSAAVDPVLALIEADFQDVAESLLMSQVPFDRGDLAERLLSDMLLVEPRIASAILSGYPDFDMGAALAACPVPVAAINGSDKPTDLAANRALDPDFQVEVLDGLGPFLFLEDPPRFHAALERTLAALATGSGS